MWAITLRFDEPADQATLEYWDSELEHQGASVAAIPGVGFTVTGYEDGDDPLKAARAVQEYVEPLVNKAPSEIEILPEAAYIRRAEEPTVPELVSSSEAADILHVTRQRIHQLRSSHPTFPAPLYELQTGPLWTRDAIEWFDRTWERKTGRPAKTTASSAA